MQIQLDHLIVPSTDKLAAAQLLAELLDVPWSAKAIGPFTEVFVSDSLTLDFDQCQEPFPVMQNCFRVEPQQFDAILARIKARGIAYRSGPRTDAVDYQEGSYHGGRIVYWDQPDGHAWEMLTVSYARQEKA